MIRRHLILVVDSHFTLVLKAFVTALEVSDDAVGYRSIYCMNVFYREQNVCHTRLFIGRRPMSTFFKNYPEWGVGRS